jgi:mono/diheme cytochrome c family protein
MQQTFINQASKEDESGQQDLKGKAKRHVNELFGGARSYKHPISDRLAFAPKSSKYKHQVNPYDETEPLEERAWSYLHTNCANCHVGAGGGNAAINLAIGVPSEKRELFDIKPKHLHFNLPHARLVAPGKPASSVLLYRMGLTGAGKMPIIGRSTVDEKGVELIREWITNMKDNPSRNSNSFPRFR